MSYVEHYSERVFIFKYFWDTFIAEWNIYRRREIL